MNAAIILGGFYAFVDYYYDDTPVKKWKLAIAILTIPTLFFTLLKLIRMRKYSLIYIFINSIDYLSLSLYSLFYKRNMSLLERAYVYNFRKRFFDRFTFYCYSEINYDFCYLKNLIHSNYSNKEILNYEELFLQEGKTPWKIFIKIFLLHNLYYCSDGLISLKESEDCVVVNYFKDDIENIKQYDNENIEIKTKFNLLKKYIDSDYRIGYGKGKVEIINNDKGNKGRIYIKECVFEENKYPIYCKSKMDNRMITKKRIENKFFYNTFHKINISIPVNFMNSLSMFTVKMSNDEEDSDSYLVIPKVEDEILKDLFCITKEEYDQNKHIVICELINIYQSTNYFGDFLLGLTLISKKN